MKKGRALAAFLIPLFTWWIVCVPHPARAQSQGRVVSGLVTCSEDGSSIAGVLVYVKGTKNFSGTQQDGMYYIVLTDRDTVLVFQMEGFRTKEVRVNESTNLNVKLFRGCDSVASKNISIKSFRNPVPDLK